jgi:hypothetical protein
MSKIGEAPPPYPQPTNVNTYGPPQNPSHQPYMGPSYGGGQPYMGPSYGGGQPIIIMQPQPHQVTVRSYRHGHHHCLCFLICLLTGGLSIPCWIWECIR